MSNGNPSIEPLTIEQTRELLARARDTQGADFIYNHDGGSCYNVALSSEDGQAYLRYTYGVDLPDMDPTVTGMPGQPRYATGCLIGTMLDLAGTTVHRTVNGIDQSIGDLAGKFDLFADRLAVRYLAAAQVAQDDGATWGEAVEAAEAVYAASLTEV